MLHQGLGFSKNYNPVLPKPPAPLSVFTNSSTSCNSFVNILSKINCAILSTGFYCKIVFPVVEQNNFYFACRIKYKVYWE